MKLNLFLPLCLYLGSVVAQDGLTVKILNGTLKGAKCASTNVNYFFSIPYAKAPVGELRFTAPQTYDQAFNGTRDATLPAPACPQFGNSSAEWTAQSEDW
jgi:para-nitrobenzyl esterase